MNEVYLRMSEEEFVVVMSALDYYANQSHIRSMYTDYTKSSIHQSLATKIFDELNDEDFRRIYDDHVSEFYFPSRGAQMGTDR